MNMFSSAEFVGEWNQIFSFKIKESDLVKPTEAFVFNALLNYLKMFNFDTAPMIQAKNSENFVERRNFLIRFCHYIDHIYKISDKAHSFVYYDLLHPAPKKTVHMLNHLLNYFFYFTMFKDSVVPVAYGKIRQREELVDKINKSKYENEQIEIKNKMIEKAIVDYRSLVPKTTSELNNLVDIEAKEKEELVALEERLSNCKTVLESLRNEEVLLTLEIVSQEEVDKLLRSKTTLTNAIAEQEAYESNSYANNQERAATLAKLQSLMTSIDEAIDLNSPTTLALHKECRIKFKELEATLSEIKRKKDCLQQTYEKIQGDLKRTEKDAASKCRLLKEIKISGEKKIEDIKLSTESSKAMVSELENELHTTEHQLNEQRDVSTYIVENTALMVKAALDYCIDPKKDAYL